MSRTRKAEDLLDPSELDSQLTLWPDPPTDLPRPWSWASWQRALALSFPLLSLGLWGVGRWLDLTLLRDLPTAFALSLGAHIVVGLLLLNRFQMRGFYASYGASANKRLNRAMRRYRKRKRSEAFHRLFARYQVDGHSYYMTWYVPGVTTAIAASLEPGSEPLVFDGEGRWIEDNRLFHRLALLWSYGMELSPGTIPLSNAPKKNYRSLLRLYQESMGKLPTLMQLNEAAFWESGRSEEYSRVIEACPAKCALFRNSLALLESRLRWADAFGWDSLVELRYKDFSGLHTAHVATIASRRSFIARHGLQAAEDASVQLIASVRSANVRSFRWQRPQELVRALEAFAVRQPIGENRFEQDSTDEWRAPRASLEAYHSRVAHARTVDDQLGISGKAPSPAAT